MERRDPIHIPNESWLDRLLDTRGGQIGALIVGGSALAALTVAAVALAWWLA